MSDKKASGQREARQENITSSKGRWLLLAGLLSFFALASYVGVSAYSSARGSVSNSVSVDTSQNRAPDFSVTTVEGSNFRLSDQKGKVVVVMFTAPG